MAITEALAAPTPPLTPDLFCPSDMNEGHLEMYWHGVAVTILSCAAYALPFVVSCPFAAPIQIIALGVLTAVCYGIANDQLACRQCIHYFTVGHTPFHRRLLATDDPIINGIVWGIHATWKEGLIAGMVMALAAQATNLIAITALQLTPFAIAIALGVCLLSHWKATEEEQAWKAPEKREMLNMRFQGFIFPNEGYHPVDLRRVPEEQRAAYLGVGARNAASYSFMPMSGLLLAVGTVAARIISTLL